MATTQRRICSKFSERNLPFEGAGAVSDWTLELSGANQFDVDSISDVVLHVRYTAARGQAVRAIPSKCSILVDLRGAFAAEWMQLENQVPVNGKRVFEFDVTRDHLPFFAKNKAVMLEEVRLDVVGGAGVVVSPSVGDTPLCTWQVELEGTDIQGAYLALKLEWVG